MAGANYEKGREQDYNYYKHIILHPYIFRWHCIPMGLCKRCRDVFVVRSCSLVPFLFHNLHQPHPYITLNFVFSTCSTNFFCAPGCGSSCTHWQILPCWRAGEIKCHRLTNTKVGKSDIIATVDMKCVTIV